jgi:hypothetical protein
MTTRSIVRFSKVSVVIAVAALQAGAAAQVPPAAQTPAVPAAKSAETPPSASGPLAPLAWLEGCWSGMVNQREYREQWMPLSGNLMVGVSQTVMQDRTLGFEYLRLEPRSDGVHYVAAPSGKNETAFRLTEQTSDRTAGRNDEIFVFTNPAQDFPQKITYRRGPSGWLYATVDGKVGGADRQVIYPMRRIVCESGELITK